MDNKTLKQIIGQIKKYKLTKLFSDIESFKNWTSRLNSKQINNFLSLDIDLKEIINVRQLLINNDLLNCSDYKEKIYAISTLKNGNGCWHLYNNICNPNFLESKNFYKDIEILSKADTARYGLQILGNNSFINSSYHDEDLKLLVETHDIIKEKPLDFVVWDAIVMVASNIDSINSPYHEADMNLIVTSGSDCLQESHSYPEHGLNYLAINKVSLADKYHLENMKILATNPIASKFLYIIMTDKDFVKGKNYRKEVEALQNAKSKVTAIALYYYIANPPRKYMFDMNYLTDCEYNVNDAHIIDKNSVAGCNDSNYIQNLIKINEIDDKFVMYYVSLLMNPEFLSSKNKKFDLELLHNVNDKSIFMDLYRLMMNNDSLSSAHHKKDVVIISQTINEMIRKLLLNKATDEISLNNDNYDYDMEYISKLNIDSIDELIFDEMNYYLFSKNGMEDPQHKEKLEKLLQGEFVERNDSVLSYFDDLEKQIDDSSCPIIESIPTISSKPKSKILSLFKKDIGK